MATVKEIFLHHGHEYLTCYGDSMPGVHKKVIRAIRRCRTEACGVTLFQCEECHTSHVFPHSCGNRHCPCCQYRKSRDWLDLQLQKQMPGHHFMLTFTMPQEIRDFLRSHQRAGYGAMFSAAAGAMKKLAADPRHIGGDLPGFLGVLHTWGRTLQYHPHIHFIVPGGALSKDDNIWHPARNNFYLPVKALSAIFRAKFKDQMKKLQLLQLIPAKVWLRTWNVNCQAVGGAEASMKYLAPYVSRVAISDSRIIKIQDRKVFFRYKKTKSNRPRVMALDVMEFMRRFLQHVLPTGFMKIRYYGLMNSSCSVSLATIRERIVAALSIPPVADPPKKEPSRPRQCPNCQGELVFIRFYPPPPAYTGLSPG